LGVLAAAALLVSAPALQAQGLSDAEEGGLFLLLPTGAQGVALGRAMSTVGSGESAFWNPAGLASLGQSEVFVYHGNQVVGDATAGSIILVRPGTGAIALSYALLDVDRFPVTDEFNQPVGSLVVRGHQGIFSLARGLTDRLRVGANAKVARFGTTCRGQCPDGQSQSTSYALDLGAQFQPLLSRGLELGVMMAHLGSERPTQGSEERKGLPARLRVGASYLILREILEEEVGFRVLVEVEDRLRSFGSPSFYFGSELRAGTTDQVYLRGGYIVGNENQIDGAAIGLGLRYERFEFGIARSLARGGPTVEREPVHLTLGISL
jgi:hypothetical protein